MIDEEPHDQQQRISTLLTRRPGITGTILTGTLQLHRGIQRCGDRGAADRVQLAVQLELSVESWGDVELRRDRVRVAGGVRCRLRVDAGFQCCSTP